MDFFDELEKAMDARDEEFELTGEVTDETMERLNAALDGTTKKIAETTEEVLKTK